jgi:hypothetical protein
MSEPVAVVSERRQLQIILELSKKEAVDAAAAGAAAATAGAAADVAAILTTPDILRAPLEEPEATPSDNSSSEANTNLAAPQMSLIDQLDAQIQSFPYVGPTMSKMLMLTTHLHYPQLGLLSSNSQVGDGAWAAFPFLFATPHDWRMVEHDRGAKVRQHHLHDLLSQLQGGERGEELQGGERGELQVGERGELQGGEREDTASGNDSNCTIGGTETTEKLAVGTLGRAEGGKETGAYEVGDDTRGGRVGDDTRGGRVCAGQADQKQSVVQNGLMAELEPRLKHMLQYTMMLTHRTLCHEQARLPPSAIAGSLNPADLQVNLCGWRKFRTGVDCVRRIGRGKVRVVMVVGR